MFAVVSDSIWLALIAGMPATIASLATFINSLRNTVKIDAIHKATNGMKDQLMASTAKASHAEGMADQRAEDQKNTK